MKNTCLALAIFSDTVTRPVFPRWAAYFNISVGLSFVSAVLLVFVRSGPVAWNGALSWYQRAVDQAIGDRPWMFSVRQPERLFSCRGLSPASDGGNSVGLRPADRPQQQHRHHDDPGEKGQPHVAVAA